MPDIDTSHPPTSSSSSKILGKLPREKAFYFFTSIGNYTGESAASLEEFLEKIKEVSTKSLEFHVYREDFEKWIAQAIEDKELAQEIQRLRNMNLTGDNLRDQLYLTVSKRYEKIKHEL
jgi:hypothetical protein